MSDEEVYTETDTKKPNRAERRALEKAEKKGRKPQRSSRLENSDLGEVYNPGEQFSEPGQAPGRSRLDQALDSGVLDGYIGTNTFRKEMTKLQDEQNAFVAWQAKQDEYIIYQNVDFDEDKGQDKWEPVSYQYYPLTVGQRLGLQKLESIANSLNRAVQNNRPEQLLVDRLNRENETYKTLDEWAYEKNLQLMQEQAARYLRMDVDKEFEISNYADLTLMIAAARYKELHIPQSQRERMPAQSSTTSKDRKYSGIS